MATNILKGRYGEDVAAIFLMENGYEIVCRNYRYKRSEIDIIALKNDLLVFVEVKYRTNSVFGYPENFVTPYKEALILEAAEQYTFERRWNNNIRFDIISIIHNQGIVHFEDAF